MTTAQIQSSVTLLSGQDAEIEPPDTDGVANEPINLAQAKDHLRIGAYQPDEDDYIQSLITAARVMAEGRINRTLVQRQRTAVFSSFCGALHLPKPPLVSIDSVLYLDADGIETPFDGYDSYLHSTPAAIALSYGVSAPALRWRPDAVRVTYTAGYADGRVPVPIRHWMLLVIGTLYENRSTVNAGTQTYSLPDDFMQSMIQQFVVYE